MFHLRQKHPYLVVARRKRPGFMHVPVPRCDDRRLKALAHLGPGHELLDRNVILVILSAPLVGIWVKLLMIPFNLLYPAILVFVCIGTYTVANSSFDVWLVLMFGALGYAAKTLKFPVAPLLLGFVLGPLMEEHFRRALILSRGSLQTFVDRPISASILLLTLALLIWTWMRGRSAKRKAETSAA